MIVQWNLGDHNLANSEILGILEILEIAMKSGWQVGQHLAVSTAKNDYKNREVSQITMQMP